MNVDNSASDLQIRLARKIIRMIHEGTFTYGTHLREIELANMLGVSRSPIRATLNFLAGVGVVDKRANRGFFVTAQADTCMELLDNLPKTGDENIRDEIAKAWFKGEINEEVSEGELRKRYDLGRLEASRILRTMSDEGIVTRMPGYGWKFEPTLNSSGAHDESYDFRIMLETSAILGKTFRFKKKSADNLRARHNDILHSSEDDWEIADLFKLDVDFHNFIADCSSNRFIVQSIKQQNKLRRLLEYNSLIDAGRLKASCLEHLAILDSLEKGNNKVAAKFMKEHLIKAKRAAPEFIAN